MVNHKIIADDGEWRVRIHDAPASGWRPLFVEDSGKLGLYPDHDQALASVINYDKADKEDLFKAELEVYVKSATTGKALVDCGLSGLVRFGDHDPYSYAAFLLPEDFLRKSDLKIFCQRDGETIYSAGWK